MIYNNLSLHRSLSAQQVEKMRFAAELGLLPPVLESSITSISWERVPDKLPNLLLALGAPAFSRDQHLAAARAFGRMLGKLHNTMHVLNSWLRLHDLVYAAPSVVIARDAADGHVFYGGDAFPSDEPGDLLRRTMDFIDVAREMSELFDGQGECGFKLARMQLECSPMI